MRLDTIQNYFFPRLDRLLEETMSWAIDIYGDNIFDDYTISKSPRHRKATKYTDDKKIIEDGFGTYVIIGFTGARANGDLVISRADGKKRKIPPVEISYTINSDAVMYVSLKFERYKIKEELSKSYYYSIVKEILKKYNDSLMAIFSDVYISYDAFSYSYKKMYEVILDENFFLHTADYYLPVDKNRGLLNMMWAFICLLPLWQALTRISRGLEPRLEEHVNALIKWSSREPEEIDNTENKNEENINDEISEEMKSTIDNLNGYKTIRAGRWWDILARDNWTCRSCGRSSLKDGVILHVDHITPRSKGGTDEMENLQTLCMKCNIGKSNRDNTDLRYKL